MKWVTINGRHLPVNDDDSEKQRQINFNKQEADRLNSEDNVKKAGLSKFDKLENRKKKKDKNK